MLSDITITALFYVIMVTNLHTNERELWNKKFLGLWQLMLTLAKLILKCHTPQDYIKYIVQIMWLEALD